MMRDKIGSFASKSSVELFLNNWIAQYVLLDDNASQEAKAQRPLREARIEVAEIPGKPGAYRSEEHTSELQSLMRISYAVFCLKKKKIKKRTRATQTPEES